MKNRKSYKTDIGRIEIVSENGSILFVSINEELNIDEKNLPYEQTKEEVIDNEDDVCNEAFRQIVEYIEGKRKKFDFPICFKGTDFQNLVWNELLKVPYGETRTYKDIAISIGNENASRAVGGAVNKNPLLIIIPCHRIIGSGGRLVGYRGGILLKERLLDIERGFRVVKSEW